MITWNLQYMIRSAPDAGGVYTFEKRLGEKDFGFLALWFVLLTYLAILWANITSVPLFARFFLGDAFQFGFHYRIFGYEVWFGEALLSICAVALVGLLCANSRRAPNGIMIAAALLSISAYPPEYESWLAYIRDMGSLKGIKAVPAYYAADHYLGQAGVTVLMFALFGVILTSLIGNMLALSRLLYAAGREGEGPRALAALNARGIPSKSIWLIVGVSAFIPFLGRTAIGWIVDVTTLGATLIYGLISHAVYRHALNEGRRAEKATGIAGLVLMGCFLVLLLIPGLLPFHAMETESYILFIVWSVLGLICFRGLIRRDPKREYGQRVIVWVILLVLVMFASMMWVSRETETAANNAVERIFEYHESHPADDSVESVKTERVAFLQEQAKSVARTNTLYTVVSLGLFLVFLFIMLENYRKTRKLGEQLTAAEEAAAAAKKIAELKETITSLLDNVPGMAFTKDAKTGAYLACNQAFAEYSHKESPEGVIGLTASQIFDAKTAKHFDDDDEIALSMDEPYIYFEDVSDAAGNQRQLQTTKLKYTDTAGRLRILGMCQDVTDMVRIQRENATTKEAYERARAAPASSSTTSPAPWPAAIRNCITSIWKRKISLNMLPMSRAAS